MFGLILTPFLGWTIGTLIGATAGNFLPSEVVSALGIAIYAMFVAIIVPPIKKSKPTLLCVLTAIILSCIFYYVPFLKVIPNGFVIIICAAVASAIFAVVSPVNISEEAEK